MLTATVLLLLQATPEFVPAHLTDDRPRKIRLIALEGERTNYDGWSRGQLRDEYDRLEAERPGIGLPITSMAVGGGLAALSALSEIGYLGAFFPPIGWIVFFAVAIVVGVGLVALGAILMYQRVPARRAMA